VRRTALDSLETGRNHHQVEATLQCVVSGQVQPFTFLLSSSRLLIHDQPHVLVTMKDITGRKQAELALAESEAKFRQLFSTVSDALVVFDAETRQFVEANETASRLYGYTREEFMQLTHRAITAEPEDSEAAIALILTGAAPRIPLRYHKKKDGTVFPVEIAGSTFALKGRPVVCGIIRDITAREQAQAALRRNEQELAHFFAQAPLGLLWVARDGSILRVNRAELELLGATGEEVYGRRVFEFHEDTEAVADLLDCLSKGETVRDYRARVRQKNGSLRHVLIDANGLWELDRLVHTRWFVRDITRRVELEQEILTISEREQRRLGNDLHDDLCQQLASIEFLSHTLASDLAPVSETGATQAKEIAQMIQRTLTQTRELARGLSPVPLEAQGLAHALRELAARTKKVFRVDCRFGNQALVLVPDHTVAIHLYRIAQEAVGNAVKHGKPNRIDIGLSAGDSSLTLAVSDDGLGLPERLQRGKGMGLRIMRYRAGVIGASLQIQRGPAGGTTVSCTVRQEGFPRKDGIQLEP
jgi:PAS domain S-box-containing protein